MNRGVAFHNYSLKRSAKSIRKRYKYLVVEQQICSSAQDHYCYRLHSQHGEGDSSQLEGVMIYFQSLRSGTNTELQTSEKDKYVQSSRSI